VYVCCCYTVSICIHTRRCDARTGLSICPTNKILLSSSLFPSLTMRSLDRKTSRACFQPDHYSIVIRRLLSFVFLFFCCCSCLLFHVISPMRNAIHLGIADLYNIAACIRGEIVTRCSDAQSFPFSLRTCLFPTRPAHQM